MGLVKTMTAIAAEAGYYDLPHFDKVFRERLGVTPQEFRRRLDGRRRENQARRAGRK